MKKEILRNSKGKPCRFQPGDFIGNPETNEVDKCDVITALIRSDQPDWVKLVVMQAGLYYPDGTFATFIFSGN